MATKRSQRVGIWAIAVVLVVSTIAMFVGLMLAPGNDARDQQRQEELIAEYQQDYEEYQDAIAVHACEVGEPYYAALANYRDDRVAAWDGSGVDELVTEDIVAGDGDIEDPAEYAAYYIGWTPDGSTFDSSFDEGREDCLSMPITPVYGGMIEGWDEGVESMQVGGVRQLTIPSDMGYGELGSQDPMTGEYAIEPDTPLRFIVMVVEVPEEPDIMEPVMNPELERLLQRGGVF